VPNLTLDLIHCGPCAELANKIMPIKNDTYTVRCTSVPSSKAMMIGRYIPQQSVKISQSDGTNVIGSNTRSQ